MSGLRGPAAKQLTELEAAGDCGRSAARTPPGWRRRRIERSSAGCTATNRTTRSHWAPARATARRFYPRRSRAITKSTSTSCLTNHETDLALIVPPASQLVRVGEPRFAGQCRRRDFAPPPDERQLPKRMHSAMQDGRGSLLVRAAPTLSAPTTARCRRRWIMWRRSAAATVEIGPGTYAMHDSLHLRPHVTVRGREGPSDGPAQGERRDLATGARRRLRRRTGHGEESWRLRRRAAA